MSDEEFIALCEAVDAAFPKSAYHWTGNRYTMEHCQSRLATIAATQEECLAVLPTLKAGGITDPGTGDFLGAVVMFRALKGDGK